jgi:hypothetical protein
VSDFHDLRDRRLWNWGAWARQGKPNLDYALNCHQFLSGGDDFNDGWGDHPADAEDDRGRFEPRIEGNTLVKPQLEAARAEYEVDIEDAEQVNGWVIQLANSHKSTLVERYQYRSKGWSREGVDSAVRAILGLAEANRAVIERMRNG